MNKSITAADPAPGYGPRLSKAEEEGELHALGPTDPTFSVDDLHWSVGDEQAATPEMALAVRSCRSDQRVLKQMDFAEVGGRITGVRTTIIAIL